MALELQDIHDEQADLEEGLDAVSEDLADVESFLFDMEDEDEEDGIPFIPLGKAAAGQ